jgi:hypothetical protein
MPPSLNGQGVGVGVGRLRDATGVGAAVGSITALGDAGGGVTGWGGAEVGEEGRLVASDRAVATAVDSGVVGSVTAVLASDVGALVEAPETAEPPALLGDAVASATQPLRVAQATSRAAATLSSRPFWYPVRDSASIHVHLH